MTDPVLSKRRIYVLRLLFAVVFFGGWYVWETTSRFTIVSTPDAVLLRLIEEIHSGELAQYFPPTGYILLVGAAFAIVVGLLLGLLMGRFEGFNKLGEVPVNTLYITPNVALVPFMVILFGYTNTTKILIVFLSGVFPVILNVAGGVRAIDKDHVELSRAFCSKEWQTWRDVILPGALPLVLTGVRVGLAHSLLGAVVADFYAGARGLGYLIIRSSNQFDMPGTIYPIVILGAIGVALVASIKWLQKKAAPWAQYT